jgi:hypothetical protein
VRERKLALFFVRDRKRQLALPHSTLAVFLLHGLA